MLTIKHHFSGITLCEFNVETVKKAVEIGKNNLRGANLYDADLRDADLRGANLYDADLRGANLYGADLRDADLRDADLRGANLYGANLDGAYLRGAYLHGANLDGADLYGADLRDADLDGEKLKNKPLFIHGMKYFCIITDDYMRLGCQRHTHEQWKNFTGSEIESMDNGALKFWKKNKTFLLAACKAHSA